MSIPLINLGFHTSIVQVGLDNTHPHLLKPYPPQVQACAVTIWCGLMRYWLTREVLGRWAQGEHDRRTHLLSVLCSDATSLPCS